MDEIRTDEYQSFLDKFEIKKTTDDCYTPTEVYDVVLSYVDERVTPLNGRRVVRPFQPGGDYEHFPYADGDVVVDNPPFSILMKIVRDYQRWRIPFFLFAPHLTAFGPTKIDGVSAVLAGYSVTYENGALVNTSFLTNMMPGVKVRVDSQLHDRLRDAQLAAKAERPKARSGSRRKKLVMPSCVITSARMCKWISRGLVADIPSDQCFFSDEVGDKKVFGGALVLSAEAEARLTEAIATVLAKEDRRLVEVVALNERQEYMRKMLNDKRGEGGYGSTGK